MIAKATLKLNKLAMPNVSSALDKNLFLSKVISVCSSRDINVWRVASKYIIKNISANFYIVIVPDSEVELFKKISPPIYQVMKESEIIGNRLAELEEGLSRQQVFRRGWYLQQFIKLLALYCALDDENILIWDADTVPLRKINFIKNGKYCYYKGSEYHPAYFRAIHDLLGIDRAVSFSFISQCFVINGKWAKEFFQSIEKIHETDWMSAIIHVIDSKDSSGFSEYESLGTFLVKHYSENILFLDSKWSRYGNGIIGDVKNLKFCIAKLVLKQYDYISFEKWDKPFSFFPYKIVNFFKSFVS